MFKSLRHRIQSLSETQQNILIILLILINIGIIIFWISFWVGLPKTVPKIEEKPSSVEEKPMEEIIKDLTTPTKEEEVPEDILKSLTAPQ